MFQNLAILLFMLTGNVLCKAITFQIVISILIESRYGWKQFFWIHTIIITLFVWPWDYMVVMMKGILLN